MSFNILSCETKCKWCVDARATENDIKVENSVWLVVRIEIKEFHLFTFLPIRFYLSTLSNNNDDAVIIRTFKYSDKHTKTL